MTHPESLFPSQGGVSATCPVVAVGASAGGLELPLTSCGIFECDSKWRSSWIQHLDSHHESGLAAILADATPMPVIQATEGLDNPQGG